MVILKQIKNSKDYHPKAKVFTLDGEVDETH
jgi:hypothetical protein